MWTSCRNKFLNIKRQERKKIYKPPNKTKTSNTPNPKRLSVPTTAITVALCCAAIIALDTLTIKLFEFAEISTVSRTAFRCIGAILCVYVPFIFAVYKLNNDGEPFKQWYRNMSISSHARTFVEIISMLAGVLLAVLIMVFVANL